MRDRATLQTVQLVQLPVEGHIRDEVERVFFTAGVLRVLNFKRVLSVEAIVRLTDNFRVADGPPTVLS